MPKCDAGPVDVTVTRSRANARFPGKNRKTRPSRARLPHSHAPVSIRRVFMPLNEQPPMPRLTAVTAEGLADRLREGPLRTLLTLQVRAGMLAADPDEDRRLEKLIELVQLAHVAMTQFNEFTLELQAVVDDLTSAAAKRN